jgi:hypothetical protein
MERVLVNFSVFHDDDEILGRIVDQVDIRERIPIDQQQIGERALFDNAELAGIRIAGT